MHLSQRVVNAHPACASPMRASTHCSTPSSCSGLANGFRAADLRIHLVALSGRDPELFSQGAITYQLHRLRLHGSSERLPNSFRYRVTEFGLRVALFFTRAYNRILRPGLAAALPGLRAIDAPLERAFDKLDAQLDAWINNAQLAAQNNLTHPAQLSPLELG